MLGFYRITNRYISRALLCYFPLILFANAPYAQGQVVTAPFTDQPLALRKTDYRLQAGERVLIDAPTTEAAFIRNAKTRSLTIAGSRTTGLALGLDAHGEIMLAASLNMHPGEYTAAVYKRRSENRPVNAA